MVKKNIPQLKYLDETPIDAVPNDLTKEFDIAKLDGEWDHINILLKEVGLISIKGVSIILGL